jgi:hypothetical protein
MKNNTFVKYVGGFVIIAVVFLLGISVGKGYSVPQTIPVTTNDIQNQSSTVSIMIDYGSGKVHAYTGIVVPAGASVFDVLQAATTAKKIDLKYKDYGGDMGIFIESIDGVGKDPTGRKWWQFWVNNAYSQVGAGSYKVQSGDTIEFKFIQGQV